MSGEVKGGLREVVVQIIWNQFHSRHGGPFYPGAKPSDSIAMALTFEAADHILAVLPTADLLEALKNAKGLIDTPIGRRRHDGDPFYAAVVASISAALAKAEGPSS